MLLAHIVNEDEGVRSFADLNDFLLKTPRGAYTTILVETDYILVNYEAHILRLVKSVAALHAALGEGCFSSFYEAFDQVITLTA